MPMEHKLPKMLCTYSRAGTKYVTCGDIFYYTSSKVIPCDKNQTFLPASSILVSRHGTFLECHDIARPIRQKPVIVLCCLRDILT
jgi:hypothetical protein